MLYKVTLKQKMKKFASRTTSRKLKISSLAIVVVVAGGFALAPMVRADRFDQQITQLQTDNSQKQQQVHSLELAANSLQDTINNLQVQINGLQAQIIANQAKNDDLQKQIAAAEVELAKQKKLLGEDIKQMYLDGQISTLEMLASSKDLSDFVDKQQYRSSVQNKIKDTLDRVTTLKLQLKTQKDEIERLLKEQQSLQAQIAAQQGEQQRLLGMNQGQQATFNSQIQDNKNKINDLRRQQVLENIKLFGGGTQPGIPGGGGYPWGNAYCKWTGSVGADCYNYDWYFNGSAWDPWGYGFRNCTSWVAYKLAASGKTGFQSLGNAASWPGAAQARGIGVTYGSGATAGDAAVNPNGFYGHVMYVEAVVGDGRVVVSDYNRLGDGLYRGPDGGNAGVLGQSGLVFIHF